MRKLLCTTAFIGGMALISSAYAHDCQVEATSPHVTGAAGNVQILAFTCKGHGGADPAAYGLKLESIVSQLQGEEIIHTYPAGFVQFLICGTDMTCKDNAGNVVNELPCSGPICLGGATIPRVGGVTQGLNSQ